MTTNVLVPLYVYPDLSSPTSQWQQLAQLGIAYPKTEIFVIVNPASGPGAKADPNYTTGISVLKDSPNIYLLGYIDTARATKTQAQVDAEMSLWRSLYDIGSFFFDNVENTKSQLYYWQLCNIVRSNGGMVFGNPGTSIPSSSIGIFDTAVIYEGDGYAIATNAPVGYDSKNFAYLLYGQNSFRLPTAPGYGYLYITSGTLPNQYNGIPYLQQLLAALL